MDDIMQFAIRCLMPASRGARFYGCRTDHVAEEVSQFWYIIVEREKVPLLLDLLADDLQLLASCYLDGYSKQYHCGTLNRSILRGPANGIQLLH